MILSMNIVSGIISEMEVSFISAISNQGQDYNSTFV